MKRLLLTISISFFLSVTCLANHITGGQIFYTYTGMSGNNYNYTVTLWLYRDHNAPGNAAALDASAPIAIFDQATGKMVWSNSVNQTDTIHLRITSPDPCITNPPTVWYEVGRYTFSVSLPASTNGYIIAYQ